MREGISGAWLMQIVTIFILLFSGYLALSMNMSKAHKVKNEIVYTIERQGGLTETAVNEIKEYINRVGYKTMSKCWGKDDDENEEWYGLGKEMKLERATPNNSYYLCVKPIYEKVGVTGEIPISAYFKVKVFFQMDLPIFGDLFKMNVKSDSKLIYYPRNIYS